MKNNPETVPVKL